MFCEFQTFYFQDISLLKHFTPKQSHLDVSLSLCQWYSRFIPNYLFQMFDRTNQAQIYSFSFFHFKGFVTLEKMITLKDTTEPA
jgi:hypothetical protein